MELQNNQNPLRISYIKCCLCGLEFDVSETNSGKCIQCLTSESSLEIPTSQGEILFCRYCKRFYRPPWILCERESKELLTICLKKIKELNSLKIVDASFVWTEPHSRRIQLKIIVQKEIAANKLIEQTFKTEFVEIDTICEECTKEFTPHTWVASIQLRQKVNHKKTFLYLEQLILKNNMNDKCLKIKEEKDGLDFFFKSKTDACKLLDFLQCVMPVQIKASKQLISHNENSNEYNYKYNYSVEIPKICKEDLVILSKKIKNMLGGCNSVLLCIKVTTSIHLLDPTNGKLIDLTAQMYFANEKEFTCISMKNNKSIVEFVVLNIFKNESNFQKKNETKNQKKHESKNKNKNDKAINQKNEIKIKNDQKNDLISEKINEIKDEINKELKDDIKNEKKNEILIEKKKIEENKLQLYEIDVARVSDWVTFKTKSHLSFLTEGSSVLGYDLTSFSEEEFQMIGNMEILLIKKARAEKAEKGGESHHIKHKVKRLEVESINENNIHKKNIHEDKEKEKDFEEVIEELQEMNLIENENKEKNEKKI